MGHISSLASSDLAPLLWSCQRPSTSLLMLGMVDAGGKRTRPGWSGASTPSKRGGLPGEGEEAVTQGADGYTAEWEGDCEGDSEGDSDGGKVKESTERQEGPGTSDGEDECRGEKGDGELLASLPWLNLKPASSDGSMNGCSSPPGKERPTSQPPHQERPKSQTAPQTAFPAASRLHTDATKVAPQVDAPWRCTAGPQHNDGPLLCTQSLSLDNGVSTFGGDLSQNSVSPLPTVRDLSQPPPAPARPSR